MGLVGINPRPVETDRPTTRLRRQGKANSAVRSVAES
jgi:hypothetical protein